MLNSLVCCFDFDLESSLERNVISYFFIRSCLIVYGFCTFGAETREGIPLGNSENLYLNQLRILVAYLICLIARASPRMAEKNKVKNLIKFRDSHRNFVRS